MYVYFIVDWEERWEYLIETSCYQKLVQLMYELFMRLTYFVWDVKGTKIVSSRRYDSTRKTSCREPVYTHPILFSFNCNY